MKNKSITASKVIIWYTYGSRVGAIYSATMTGFELDSNVPWSAINATKPMCRRYMERPK